jgi:hypothetical protein
MATDATVIAVQVVDVGGVYEDVCFRIHVSVTLTACRVSPVWQVLVVAGTARSLVTELISELGSDLCSVPIVGKYDETPVAIAVDQHETDEFGFEGR